MMEHTRLDTPVLNRDAMQTRQRPVEAGPPRGLRADYDYTGQETGVE